MNRKKMICTNLLVAGGTLTVTSLNFTIKNFNTNSTTLTIVKVVINPVPTKQLWRTGRDNTWSNAFPPRLEPTVLNFNETFNNGFKKSTNIVKEGNALLEIANSPRKRNVLLGLPGPTVLWTPARVAHNEFTYASVTTVTRTTKC